MRPILLRAAVAATALFVSPGVLMAQDQASGSRQRIISATQEARHSAEVLKERMARAIPVPAGWQCAPENHRPERFLGPATALVILRLECRQGEQSLRLFLTLDPTSAGFLCRVIDSTKYGIAQGTVRPDLFRFFEGDTWRIMRGSVDLTGCAQTGVAFKASGRRTDAALAEGFEPIDQFAEAMLGMDVSGLSGQGVPKRHAETTQALLRELDAQSMRLFSLIPHPDLIDKDSLFVTRQTLVTSRKLPLTMFIAAAPEASADLEIEGCKVRMSLNASVTAIHEAKHTGLRWASYDKADGNMRHDWMMRNTDRFVGQQSLTGNNFNLLINNRLILKVFAKETESCADPGSIVIPIVDEILTNDLSELGVD